MEFNKNDRLEYLGGSKTKYLIKGRKYRTTWDKPNKFDKIVVIGEENRRLVLPIRFFKLVNKTKMQLTTSQKVQYLKTAMSLQHLGFKDETIEKIIKTYDLILEKGGEFTLKDAIEISTKIDRKYLDQKLKEEDKL